jgi:hypothetical protein
MGKTIRSHLLRLEMAEDKGPWGVVFQFVDRFFTDKAIWFWTVVFCLGTWLADYKGWVILADIAKSPKTMVTVGGWFAFCMLMNALGVHGFIGAFCGMLIEHFVFYRLRRRAARKTFRKIMRVDCQERDWLIWYIFAFQAFPKSPVFELVRDKSYFDGRWNSETALWLLSEYHVFSHLDGSSGEDIFYGANKDDRHGLRVMLDFLGELKSMTKHDPTLRAELQNIRAEVSTLNVLEVEKRGKPMFSTIKERARELERRAF